MSANGNGGRYHYDVYRGPGQRRPALEQRLAAMSAEIQPTYRLVAPTVCAMSEKVERTGIEPVTSGLQSRRSPV